MSRRKYKKKTKKQNTTVIKPDIKVNVVIDYDKLAEAIVKAEKKAENEEHQEIKHIFALQKNGTSMLYKVLGMMGYFFSGLIIVLIITTAFTVKWSSVSDVVSNVLVFVTIATATICIIVISNFLHKASKEIEKIKDKQLLISLSTSLTGFIALIVAIIAIL